MFNRKVYNCELLSITPDIIAYSDKNMKKNLVNAKCEVVERVLVQKTIRPDYVKEIVTNTLIPIYYETYYNTTTRNKGKMVSCAPASPIFIKVHEVVGDEGLILESNLISATIDEVKMYAFDHLDREKFKNKLDELYLQGMEYYNNSLDKGLVSEEEQIKRMVKAIKRCNKI